MPEGRKNGIIDTYRRLIVTLALNVPLVAAVLMLDLRNVDFSALTWIYFSTVALGYYVLLIFIVLSIVYLMLVYLRRVAAIVATAAVTAAVFFLIIDSYTYQVTRIHINPFWMEWIINDLSAFGLSRTTLHAVLYLLIGLILFEAALYYVAGKIARPRGLAIAFAGLLVLSLATGQVIHLMAYEENVASITSLSPHLPIYYPVTSHGNAQKYRDLLPLQNEVVSFASSSEHSTLTYPLKSLKFSTDSTHRDPNILVILFESWRADAMTPAVTPNTWQLAGRSSVFTDHYCSGNSTIAGVFGLFFGLHPTYWSAVKADNARIHNPVLIDELEARNYSFGIFARSNFKRHKIKDAVFRGIKVHKTFAGNNAVDRDRDMTQQLISFLGKQARANQPFMAMAFYKSNHAPYQYPPRDSLFLPAGDQNLITVDRNTDPRPYHNDYLNATHYVDRLVGDVLESADSLGLMSNTIVIVTTDHAEEFNDNQANYWGHGSNFTKFQTKIPLVLYVPGRAPRRIDYRTSHVDIVPTLLGEFFGCVNDPGDYSNGHDIYHNTAGVEPLVIGSYVNHAFVIDDNVYEILPYQTRTYRLNDINASVSGSSLNEVKTVFKEISRFFQPPELRPLPPAPATSLDTLLTWIDPAP